MSPDIAGNLRDRVAAHPLLATVARDMACQLADSAQAVWYEDGTAIFAEGDLPDYLDLVLEGGVDIVKATPDGWQRTIAQLAAGAYFGDFSVLDGQPRSAGAIAKGRTCLARVPREAFRRALETASASTVLNLARKLVNDLREMDNRYIRDVVTKTKMSALGEMLNTILHDFRNPFAVIGMAAEIIHGESPDSPQVAQCLKMIEEQIGRMSAMTDDILDFSRGVVRLREGVVMVPDLLRRFEELNRIFLSNSGVLLLVTAEPAQIHGDADKLIRVLQNLVNNAVEAMGEKGGKIEVRARNQGNTVEIGVGDNGPGISDAVRNRLFEPFATHGKAKGIGLGLPIVKQIVESHGGKVRVETAAGAGTTFFLTLPIFR
jgi:signal transduction histidine kinase